MNRLKRHYIEQDLKDFASAKPDGDIYKKLPRPLFFPQDRLGTNIEYIWRLILEGNEVQRQGDSLLPSFRFSFADVSKAQKGIQAIDRIARNPAQSGWKDWKHLNTLPAALQSILTYHLDKANACNKEYSAVKEKLDKAQIAFSNACRDGDYLALADLYPYCDGVLEIDEDMVLPAILIGKMSMPTDWKRQQRASAISKVFSQATQLNPSEVIFNLGQYETGVGSYAFRALRSDQERNFSIYKNGMAMAIHLANVIGRVEMNNDFPLAEIGLKTLQL